MSFLRRALALGAFFVSLPSSPPAAVGTSPATASRRSTTRPIKKATFDHWMQIAAASAAGQQNPTATTAPKVSVPNPDDASRPASRARRPRRPSRPRARPRRPTPSTSSSASRSTTAYKRPGPVLPHPRHVARGRGRQAGRQGRRRGRPEAASTAAKQSLPEDGRLPEVPQELGPDATRTSSSGSSSQLIEQKITRRR